MLYYIHFRFVVTIFLVFFGLNASAQFASLHQIPQSYTNTKNISVTYTGFRNQFSPTGVLGCQMGVVELRSECVTVPGGMGLVLPDYMQQKEFKVYVPVGTKVFSFFSYLPQGTLAAVAVRASRAPDRVTSLNESEYDSYKFSQNAFNVFERVSAGQEVILVHNGGGSFPLGGRNTFSTPLAKGVWLYFRIINGDSGYAPSVSYEIDLPTYLAGYNAITQANGWGIDGDPIDTTNSGSTGGTTTPPTPFSIKLSITTPPDTTTLTQGVSSTIAITPSSGFTLKSCSAASVSTSSYDDINKSMTLTPNSTNPVTITCTSTTGATAEAKLPVQASISNVPLTKISLSRGSLPNNDVTSEITIEPNPGASLPSCMVRELDGAVKSVYIEAPNAAGKFKLAAGIPADVKRDLVVDCGGGVTASFKIVLPLKVEVASVFNETTKLTTVTVQNFLSYLPSTVTSADFYVLVYVPKIPITQFGVPTEDKLYGYLVAQGQTKLKDVGWQIVPDLLLPILFNGPDEPYKTYQIDAANGGKFTFSLGYGVTQKDADSANVEYYLAYLPAGSVVSFADGSTGKDWTKLQFIGDKKGGSFSVSPLIKFPVK